MQKPVIDKVDPKAIKKEQIDHAGVSYITSQIWTLYMHLELCGVKQKKHKFDTYSHPKCIKTLLLYSSHAHPLVYFLHIVQFMFALTTPFTRFSMGTANC